MKLKKIVLDNSNVKRVIDETDYPSVEDLGIDPRPHPRPAGDKFPVPGVSDQFPKYSGTQDYMIGPRRGVGHVNDNANETYDWSSEDVANSGLTMRQPL